MISSLVLVLLQVLRKMINPLQLDYLFVLGRSWIHLGKDWIVLVLGKGWIVLGRD